MVLGRIQELLAELYDVPTGPAHEGVDGGPELVAAALGDDSAIDRGELLLVSEDADGVHVALYVDPDALVRAAAPSADFGALCLATEGVSHFVYLSFRADNEERVSQLELELQAEVDKYATALLGGEGATDLAGNGAGLIRARSRALRQRRFERARFLDDGDSEEGARYRVAHRAAARYVARLERRYVDTGKLDELFVELRRFYRLGSEDKLAHTR